MPLWRAQAYLQEMSGALLSSEYERAYQNSNAMVWPQDDYLPSDSSYPTSHLRDNSAKKGLLNVVTAVFRRVNPTAFAMGFSYFYSAEFIRHLRGPQRALLEWGEEE